MLEATMVLMDSSSWAINTDTGLTRWATQLDCAKMLFNAKTTSNPENVVGVMTMAGKGPEVLASPTQNYGAIVSALSNVRLEGDIDLITSIQVAQLALKHRQNKNLRQRIIALVGSPLESTTADDLVKLGKRLKKNNVACDIINFGEDAENEDKLAGFVEAVTSQNNSHLVTVPAGTVLLSDMIHSSGMLSEDGVPTANGSGSGGGGTSGTGAGSGAGEDGEYGVDPNLDPELAMALRMSLEEERARQAASQRSQGQSNNPEQLAAIPETSAPSTSGPDSSSAATSALTPKLSQAAASGPASASDVNVPDTSQQSAMASSPLSSLSSTSAERRSGGISAVKTEEEDESMEADEDADLARALALSRGGEGIDGGGGGGDDNDEDHDMADAHGANEGDDGEISEEEAMARAIALSMQDQNQDKTL